MKIQFFIDHIASQLQISQNQVRAALKLLEEGATIPFIARYRKEATGMLDEVQLTDIRDIYKKLQELERRRSFVLKTIEDQGKLTSELKLAIEKSLTLTELEDIYLPYKPKRKTRATQAKEKGLEPLALQLLEQIPGNCSLWAKKYISAEKGVESVEHALQGARDIIAEIISEQKEVRQQVRKLFIEKATIHSKVIKGKEAEAVKYKDYFDWSEPLHKVPSHRMLAMRRGEKEGYLLLDITPEESDALFLVERASVKNTTDAASQVKLACKDAYKRLLYPSIESEVRLLSKEKADDEAIKTFSANVYELLMASPLGQKIVLAIDPGFRTGCKMVILNAEGKLLDHTVIYLEQSNRRAESAQTLLKWIETYKAEVIAIGNGTASRETEAFVRECIKSISIPLVIVNESGASIYSASDVAREEFPNHDITVRGAVSIGRRLQDPLAELVKIDPKSIGVGQYQHDVDQQKLKDALDDTVISCVNKVGVELNTASKQLLMYVSGLGPVLAQNIVEYRQQHGPFASRDALKKVPRMGEKAFEQAAGFLRIRGAANPLDASGVHPERYALVEQMAKDIGVTVPQLMQDEQLRKKIKLSQYMHNDVAMPTLQDIMQELAKPGRDPRAAFEVIQFSDTVRTPEDLKVGMKLTGVVTNVTKFGAFVDIGVHQDGLVHISHLKDGYVRDPAEVIKVAQKVEVVVIEVDLARKRVALSMKKDPFQKNIPSLPTTKREHYQEEDEGNFESKLHRLKHLFKK